MVPTIREGFDASGIGIAIIDSGISPHIPGLDNVVFNAPRSLFAAGQAYVGLSRARSLDRLLLRRPLTRRDILLSEDAVAYRSLLLPLETPARGR